MHPLPCQSNALPLNRSTLLKTSVLFQPFCNIAVLVGISLLLAFFSRQKSRSRREEVADVAAAVVAATAAVVLRTATEFVWRNSEGHCRSFKQPLSFFPS